MTQPTSTAAALPSASSPSLILTQPTDPEAVRTWTGNFPEWRGSITSVDDYIARERYLLTIPLARDGGITQWILTTDDSDAAIADGARPVLCSCETIRKPALIKGKDGVVREGMAHGVASVFTLPEFRGKGYASRMMAMLGDAIRESDQDALFSALWSDIGQTFYAKSGWIPADSDHIEFSAKGALAGSSVAGQSPSVRPLFDDDLPSLAARDGAIVREQVSSSVTTAMPAVAILPCHSQLLWHLHREDFICTKVFGRAPTVRGALYTPSNDPGARVWAVWTSNFKSDPAKSQLSILRFVVENENISDAELLNATRAVFEVAQKEALQWGCGQVHMWNPGPRVEAAALMLGAESVTRESDAIASIKMFGDDVSWSVNWIANEKFAWC